MRDEKIAASFSLPSLKTENKKRDYIGSLKSTIIEYDVFSNKCYSQTTPSSECLSLCSCI